MLKSSSVRFFGDLCEPELDLRFGSAKIQDLELNFELGPRGSGSNLGTTTPVGQLEYSYSQFM